MVRFIVLITSVFLIGVAAAQEPSSVIDFDQNAVQIELERRVADHQRALDAAKKALDEVKRSQARTGPAVPAREGELEPKIVNGVLTARFPTAGALVKVGPGGTLKSHCSGTLIGCSTFLTAQHCIEQDRNAASYRVFLQHGGIYEVSQIAAYQPYSFPDGDIAILRLTKPVSGIEPTRLQEIAPTPGTRGIIVGFGRSGGLNYDYGLKRVGQVKTASCKSPYSNENLICWNFNAPIEAPGEHSNTCNADSGGPLFFESDSGAVVGGATSGGVRRSCMPSDHSYDGKIAKYRSWIVQQASGDIGKTSCDAIGSKQARVQAGAKELKQIADSVSFEFPVQRSAKAVRVSLNATDDSVAKFDYFVSLNGPASPSSHDCRPNSGQYGFCEFQTVSANSVHVLSQRKEGEGWVQVVVTELE